MSDREEPSQPIPEVGENVSATPAPAVATHITTQAATAKPCGCGCMPVKVPFVTPAYKRATPEFKAKIAGEAKVRLGKATEVTATTRSV